MQEPVRAGRVGAGIVRSLGNTEEHGCLALEVGDDGDARVEVTTRGGLAAIYLFVAFP